MSSERSNIWVSCPDCKYPFYVGPEYIDPAQGHPCKPEVAKQMFCKCPKCFREFTMEESATKPGLMPWMPKTLEECP